jgi:hypothetical protein
MYQKFDMFATGAEFLHLTQNRNISTSARISQTTTSEGLFTLGVVVVMMAVLYFAQLYSHGKAILNANHPLTPSTPALLRMLNHPSWDG